MISGAVGLDLRRKCQCNGVTSTMIFTSFLRPANFRSTVVFFIPVIIVVVKRVLPARISEFFSSPFPTSICLN